MNNSSRIHDALLQPPSGNNETHNWIQLSMSLATTIIIMPPTAVLLCTKALRTRKELFLVGLLSLYELVNAIGYMITAINVETLLDTPLPGVTTLDCMKVPSATMLAFGNAACSWSTLLLSVDRFLCIVASSYFRTLDKKYYMMLRIVPVVAGAVNIVGSWTSSSLVPNAKLKHPSSCNYQSALDSTYSNWMRYLTEIPGFLVSCVIYALALAFLWLKKGSQFGNIAKQEKRRQRKITMFIGLVSIINFFTYGILNISRFIPLSNNPIMQASSNLKQAQAILSALILWTRSTDVRETLVVLFRKYVLKNTSSSVSAAIGFSASHGGSIRQG